MTSTETPVSSPAGSPVWPQSSQGRRVALVALILLLHLGFFTVFKQGLLQGIMPVVVPDVVMAVIFPPEAPPVPPVHSPATPQPLQVKPIVQRRTPPKPSVPKPAVQQPARRTPTAAPPPPDLPATAPTPAEPATAAPTTPADLAPPRAAASPAGPKTITSGVQYLQPPQPDYPAQSKRLGEEGRVVLRVAVDESGHAGQIVVQTTSGFARLDDAAIEAVRRARFKPHLEDGKPLAVFVIVPIRFRLDQ